MNILVLSKAYEAIESLEFHRVIALLRTDRHHEQNWCSPRWELLASLHFSPRCPQGLPWHARVENYMRLFLNKTQLSSAENILQSSDRCKIFSPFPLLRASARASARKFTIQLWNFNRSGNYRSISEGRQLRMVMSHEYKSKYPMHG